MRYIFFIIVLIFISSGSLFMDEVPDNRDAAGTVDEAMFNESRVVLLGTGNPNSDPERSGPCVAVVVKGRAYLVDFGPGIVRRAAAAFRKGVKSLKTSKLDIAFLTHLHSDHTVGYPDLIFTPWVLGRKVPLEVYGPPGIESMTHHIHEAYKADIKVRLDGLEPASPEGYKVNVHTIKAGVVYKDTNITVTAFPVKHGAWGHSFGFRFDTPDKSIVISGDCVPSEELIKHAKGCDILVHEVYSEKGFQTRKAEWQKYHRDSHTSTVELAEIANKTRPGLIVLYHLLFWGTTPDELVKEIGENYDGKVVSGVDLGIY